MFMFSSLRIWILSLWAERFQINWSMKWYICSGESAFLLIFTGIEEKNFVYLNGRDVGQPGALEIVGNFIDQRKQNLWMLQESLARYKGIFQYAYLHVFPEIYTTLEKGGFNLKSNFHIIFKAYQDKMAIKRSAREESIKLCIFSNRSKRNI